VSEPPDLLTLRKLAIVRQVYLTATRQRGQPTAVSRLIAVVEYDLAIETVLKSVLAALQRRALGGDFADLIKQVRAALAAKGLPDLPRADAVQRVRSIRNAAQHEGRLPTIEEADECHVIARGFLDATLGLVWDLSLDGISLAGLIADDASRARIAEGEQHLASDNKKVAVEKAGEALEWALLRVKNALVGRGDPWARAILTEDAFGKPKASREMTASIQRTQETVLYLALGLDYGELVRFRGVAGSVVFTLDGGAAHYGMKDGLNDADAELALAYAAEALVQIESRVGTIDKPFGRDRWY